MLEYYYQLIKLKNEVPLNRTSFSHLELDRIYSQFLEIDSEIRKMGSLNIPNNSKSDTQSEIRRSEKVKEYFSIAKRHVIDDITELANFIKYDLRFEEYSIVKLKSGLSKEEIDYILDRKIKRIKIITKGEVLSREENIDLTIYSDLLKEKLVNLMKTIAKVQNKGADNFYSVIDGCTVQFHNEDSKEYLLGYYMDYTVVEGKLERLEASLIYTKVDDSNHE